MELIINSKPFGIKVVFYDDQFDGFIKSKNWTIVKRDEIFYAVSRIKENGVVKVKYLHTVLFKCPKGKIIDHRDGNGLNNKSSNIRFVSESQNLMNRGAPLSNTTGFKGVHKRRDTGKFDVRISAHGIQYYGGCFDSLIEAAKRYNELAIIHHGEFAKLNVI
jgi:hypothetical protein